MATLLCLAVAIVSGSNSPAGAQSAVTLVVEGTGTIAPGLSIKPEYQTFTWNSTTVTAGGVVDGRPAVGTSFCNAAGGGIVLSTIAAGSGVGTWACHSGPLAGKAGNLNYARAGVAAAVALTGSLSGALTCKFEPAEGQDGVTAPVSDFTLTCSGSAAGS